MIRLDLRNPRKKERKMNCESGEAEHSDDLLNDVTDIERLIVDI